MTAPFVLLTDFGTDDPYAGQMRAVLHSLAPHVPILDLTHGVPPHGISSGALFLAASRSYFPERSLFLCVVDPGVGSSRPMHCVVQQGGKGHVLLGPGNGLLSLAGRDMAEESGVQWFTLSPLADERPASETFHGRDVFPRLAVALSQGVFPERLGSPLPEAPPLPDWANPIPMPEGLACAVLHVDRFGNCILNLRADREPPAPACVLLLPARPPAQLHRVGHYAELPPGETGLLRGSQGYWELARYGHSAAARLGLQAGQRCTLACLHGHNRVAP